MAERTITVHGMEKLWFECGGWLVLLIFIYSLWILLSDHLMLPSIRTEKCESFSLFLFCAGRLFRAIKQPHLYQLLVLLQHHRMHHSAR
jgi:hypothetical protein